jgi:hypothetical protein
MLHETIYHVICTRLLCLLCKRRFVLCVIAYVGTPTVERLLDYPIEFQFNSMTTRLPCLLGNPNFLLWSNRMPLPVPLATVKQLPAHSILRNAFLCGYPSDALVGVHHSLWWLVQLITFQANELV